MPLLPRTRSFSEEFDLIDANKDDLITKEELQAALRRRLPDVRPSEAELWASGLMRTYDVDGNGVLDRREFSTYVNARYEELGRIFDELDISRTGRISKEDVKSGLQRAKVPHLEADVDRVLKRMVASADDGVTADGVNMQAFFHASVLLPVHNAEGMLLIGMAGAFPVSAPPPGTTPSMIVAAGFINGAVSRTITAPTDRLRALLATGKYPDLRTAARSIVESAAPRHL